MRWRAYITSAVLALLVACGGAQKKSGSSGDDVASAADAADAVSAPPGKMVIRVMSKRSSNHGRPFRVLARGVNEDTFLTDTYSEVSELVMKPDETVAAMDVIYPGQETVLTMDRPEKDSIALYFLFTDPEANWKTYLDAPVSSTVTLGDHAAERPVAAPALEPPAEPEEPGAENKGGMSTQRKLALVSGGLGVAGLITGTVLGLVANSRYDQGLALCTDSTNGTGCSQEGVDLGTSAQNLGLGANISFGVGGAAVVAGAILWFTAPSGSGGSSDTASAFQWQPYAGPDSAGVMVRGSF